MIQSDPDRNPVEVLADEFARRCRQGERPSASEYAEKYPEYAEEIRDLFPSVGMMEQLNRKENVERELLERHSKFQGKPFERIGEFEILREIGRGGMGVVFEARQKSLGRRVALKVLSSGFLSTPKQLLRFHREATAAARLHHTNIVPVFGVGEQDDMHYYVMQFIDGVALDEVLRVLRKSETNDSCTAEETPKLPTTDTSSPSESRSSNFELDDAPASVSAIQAAECLNAAGHCKAVARIGLQVADALRYAHAQGVLHRDIKPANLLLDTQGATWIADFGLAKLAENDALTKSGDIVGTLRYMAPEQFYGQGDERSDIYSLGLTLYELLTLRQAREELRDAQGFEQFACRSLPAPRSIDSDIPRDLETIVLKAMAPEPDRRYASADAMAEDLERFLDDRPILARRASTAERMWRWGRRNPLSAMLTVSTLSLLVLIAVVASVSSVRTKMALARSDSDRKQVEQTMKLVESQRNRAQDEHARAEANLDLAMTAFKDIIESVSSRGMPHSIELDSDEEDSPRFESVVTAADAELLQNLLKFFDEFARQNRADLQEERVQAYRRVGDIRQRLIQFDQAETAYREALAIQQALLQKRPGDVTQVVAQAEIFNDLGAVLGKNGQHTKALESHRAAEEFLNGQPSDIGRDKATRFELARTLNLLTAIEVRSGGFPHGFHGFRRPGGDGRPNGENRPNGDNRPTGDFRPGGGNTPNLMRRPPSRPEDGSRFRESPNDNRNAAFLSRLQEKHHRALELLHELVAEEPKNADYQLALARCYRNQWSVVRRANQTDIADKSLDESIRILDQLVAGHPNNPQFRFELADTLSLTGWPPPATAPDEESRKRLERAVALGQELNAALPSVPEYRALLAGSHAKLASIERRSLELAAADEHYRQAVTLQTALAEQYPAAPIFRFSLGRPLREWGDLKRERGQLAESRQVFENGIKSFELARDSSQENPFYDRALGDLYQGLSETLRKVGDDTAADQAVRKARELGEHHWPRGPGFSRRPPRGSSDKPKSEETPSK
jgi:serine/threonine protein kinase